jgi:hypothetical protein
MSGKCPRKSRGRFVPLKLHTDPQSCQLCMFAGECFDGILLSQCRGYIVHSVIALHARNSNARKYWIGGGYEGRSDRKRNLLASLELGAIRRMHVYFSPL